MNGDIKKEKKKKKPISLPISPSKLEGTSALSFYYIKSSYAFVFFFQFLILGVHNIFYCSRMLIYIAVYVIILQTYPDHWITTWLILWMFVLWGSLLWVGSYWRTGNRGPTKKLKRCVWKGSDGWEWPTNH